MLYTYITCVSLMAYGPNREKVLDILDSWEIVQLDKLPPLSTSYIRGAKIRPTHLTGVGWCTGVFIFYFIFWFISIYLFVSSKLICSFYPLYGVIEHIKNELNELNPHHC